MVLLTAYLFQSGMTTYASVPDADSGSDSQQEQTAGDQAGQEDDFNASPEKETEVTQGDSSSGYTGGNSGSETTVPSDEELGIAPNSLLPVEEKYVNLDLTGYSRDKLKNMPVKTMLELLADQNRTGNNKFEISEGQKVVLASFENQDEYVKDVYRVIERDDTVDLTEADIEDKDEMFTMVLLVGTGSQLDYNAVRYEVTVEISAVNTTVTDQLTFYLTRQGETMTGDLSGDMSRLYMESTYTDTDRNINIPMTTVVCFIPSYEGDDEYFLGIFNRNLGNADIYVYHMKDFLEHFPEAEDDVSKLEEHIYMGEVGTANIDIGSAQEAKGEKNTFCVVYSEPDTGKIIAYRGLTFEMHPEKDVYNIVGSLYVYENGEMKDAIESISKAKNTLDWSIPLASSDKGIDVKYQDIEYKLKEAYRGENAFYYVTKDTSVKEVWAGKSGGEDGMDHLVWVTDDVIPGEGTTAPYGYCFDPSEGKRAVKLILEDGTTFKYFIRVKNMDSYDPDSYDPAPFVGKQDTYFNVDGYYSSGSYNGNSIALNDQILDTYYGYGYQTLLIKAEKIDLTNLTISFSSTGADVYVGEEKQSSGTSNQDFSKGPVNYQAHIRNTDAVREYQVTAVTRAEGPKLFVNGPSEREIFLDEYFGYEHSILIANIGDEDLTGLKVELVDAENVKLDDYWTVGDDKNTLKGFTDDPDSKLSMAKITLLPDGEGVISGTLRISADGREPVEIKLTGYSGDNYNPSIITEELDEAANGEAYSCTIENSKLHYWEDITVTFSLIAGELPQGLMLDSSTGEISGTPEETGEFPINVRAKYSGDELDDSYKELTLKVTGSTSGNDG